MFGWRGGKVGGWKTLLFGWREKGNDNHDLENEDQKDFVDVLLWVQKENVIGFSIERVSIKRRFAWRSEKVGG